MKVMNRFLSGAALLLLIESGGLLDPAWGNHYAGLRLAQASIQGNAGLDEGAIKNLIEKAEKLHETGDLKGATEIYLRVLDWNEKYKGP